MVGNDVTEDMCASQIRMDVFLLEGNVINENNINVSEIKKGNWNVFKQYISNLPTLK